MCVFCLFNLVLSVFFVAAWEELTESTQNACDFYVGVTFKNQKHCGTL